MATVPHTYHPSPYQVGRLLSPTPRRSSHQSLPAAAPAAALGGKPALLGDLEAILRCEALAMQIKVALHIF